MMEVKEFSHEVLSIAVDFMYGMDIPEDFDNEKELANLLDLAKQYLMEDLKDAVGSRIGKALSKENIMEMSKLADKYEALNLSEECAEFIIENKDAVEEEELENLGRMVLAALGLKAMVEFKNNSWVSKLWGEKVDFKRREHFDADKEYKGYVMARVQPKMLVRCNQKSSWESSDDGGDPLMVEVGDIGCVQSIEFSAVTVKWLNAGSMVNRPHHEGPFEIVDLLTMPVKFNW